MLTSIFSLKEEQLQANPLKIPENLQESLGIRCDNEESRKRFMDYLESIRAGAGGFHCSNMIDDVEKIKIGEENYIVYQRPDDTPEEDWKEFCTIVCEAGYVSETPEYNIASRKQLVAIDAIMFEAMTRYAGRSYLDYNDRTGRGAWVNVTDIARDGKILLGAYYTGMYTYEVAAEFEENNRKRLEEPTNKSSIIFKVLEKFRKMDLDKYEEIYVMVKDVNNLTADRISQIMNVAFMTKRNYRLLTRASTLHEINEIYKLFV